MKNRTDAGIPSGSQSVVSAAVDKLCASTVVATHARRTIRHSIFVYICSMITWGVYVADRTSMCLVGGAAAS